MYCSKRHGDGAVGGGVIADLRWSPINRSAEAWRDVVIRSAKTSSGMVSFAPLLSAAEAAYVVQRENDAYAEEHASTGE
jgi:hypothetical protein